jgi:predicted phosphodiesterase
MKSLIITDLHETHPREVVQKAIKLGIEKIVSLGDIETPDIMKYLLDLKIKKRIIIGDHEYNHTHGLEIHSRSMTHDYEYYQDLWEESPREMNFVRKASKKGITIPGKTNGILVEENINGRKVCYVHGSLLREEPLHPGHEGIMWGRILYDNYGERKRMNFKIMKERGYSILFRGHDHHCETLSMNLNDDLEKAKIESEYFEEGTNLKFEKNKLYIVTLGSFENGNCAIFDDSRSYIEFTHRRNLQ